MPSPCSPIGTPEGTVELGLTSSSAASPRFSSRALRLFTPSTRASGAALDRSLEAARVEAAVADEQDEGTVGCLCRSLCLW